jgi:endonuclease/exonuclease/phosphatase (EEP) superfamily protein YafD
MIASLLDASDFAAPLATGEYILIFPGQQGPAAKHRMREISQHLWDLQMQSLLQHGVSFQWGGLEVADQDFQDAVRMSQERRESRGERKLPAAQAAKAHQRAV